MSNKRIFLIITIFIIIVSGCSKNVDQNIQQIQLDSTDFNSNILNTDNRDKLPNAKSGGVSLGLYNTNGQIEKDFNFNLNENQSIKKFISLGNLIDEDRIYKVLLFIDYKQEKFSVDGKEPKNNFTFKAQAGETIEIPFEIAPLSKGLHDILFVIAKYPDNRSLDDEFRKKTDLNHLLFLRFSTVVGGDDTIGENIKFNVYGESQKDDILDGVLVTKNNNYKRWLTHNISKGESLEYYSKIGNNSEERRTYALITLFDWEQVDVVKGKKSIFFDLNKNTLINLKSNIPIQKDEGIYDLTPILIHNPFQKLNLYNREVETGIRIGVNIKK